MAAKSKDVGRDIARLALVDAKYDTDLLEEVLAFCWDQLQWRKTEPDLIALRDGLSLEDEVSTAVALAERDASLEVAKRALVNISVGWGMTPDDDDADGWCAKADIKRSVAQTALAVMGLGIDWAAVAKGEKDGVKLCVPLDGPVTFTHQCVCGYRWCPTSSRSDDNCPACNPARGRPPASLRGTRSQEIEMTENSKRHMDACPYCASELVVAERDDEVGYICEARHRGCGCSFWFSKTNNLEGQVR